MVIVETKEEVQEFLDLYHKENSLLIPTYSDFHRHPARNELSLVYVYFPISNLEYILPFNHSEGLSDNIKISLLKPKVHTFVYEKKKFSYFIQSENFYDADLVSYFVNNETLELSEVDTTAHTFFNRLCYKEKNVNDIIPISKHYERFVNIRTRFISLISKFRLDESFKYYNTVFIDTLFNIEKNGLFVDYLKFIDVFGQNGLSKNLTFSEYNIYTSTGRPSNRHSNINYAALPKDDGCRSVFISRFQKDGFLIQFDYDAYHPRLIANLIGFDLPYDQNVHEYFGKQYFNNDTLTKAQYDESKSITFRQLYGGVQEEYRHIPFYSAVTQYIETQWHMFKHDGYIETPLFKRKLYREFFDDINKNKLFNYILQALETERNMIVLNGLNERIRDFKSKVILYTYDSILIDYCISDGKEFILLVKDILQDGKFPVKIQIGADYHKMDDVSI